MTLIANSHPTLSLQSWRDMAITGQIVFCKVCQRQRFSATVVADVSSLNVNVLFEIGYALGLGLPVIPIRDVSYVRDAKDFDELGILDTFGYVDFENSEDLAKKLPEVIKTAKAPFGQQYSLSQDQPLYIIKSPVATDGLIKLLSGVKKSGLRFRTFDPKETSRLSLQDAFKQVQLSLGVIAHLMSSNRRGAKAHNARAAFICGLAMASEKYVMMLQEEDQTQPIDYRDVVRTYTDPVQIQMLLGSFIQPLYEAFQNTRFVPITLPLRPLETLDFGDVAAENEINALKSYFVATAQYQDVRRGHARLVVGRKGSGKSAIFYGVRNAYWTSQSHLVLDLKPEGHQFTKLKEALLSRLSHGMQEHVLTAFWNYLLLTELAYKIIDIDADVARRSSQRYKLYSEVQKLSGWEPNVEQGDFSERLLETFSYLLSRTMMRPRDLLRLLRECVNVAVNRGHSKVTESDVIYAEKSYSEDQLQELMFEMRDVEPGLPDILYAFIGSSVGFGGAELGVKLATLVEAVPTERGIDLLLWFCFLGVIDANGEERFAYQYQYGVKRMLQDAISPIRYTIHPALRLALGCLGYSAV
jgi:hypothetical protein